LIILIVRIEPLDIGATGGDFVFFVPAGGGAFLEPFAARCCLENQLGATVGAVFVELFGCAVLPLDVVAAGSGFGRWVPFRSGTLFHFLAKPRYLKN